MNIIIIMLRHGTMVKNLPANEGGPGDTGRRPPRPPEEEMANHPRILAWEIPWTEEPGRLQSMGLERIGPDRTEHTGMKDLSDKYRNNPVASEVLKLDRIWFRTFYLKVTEV